MIRYLLFFMMMISYSSGLFNNNHLNKNCLLGQKKETCQLNESKKCCVYCTMPLVKCFSIPKPFENCGETCLHPKHIRLYKILEPTLQKANTTTPCNDNGFLSYNRTDMEGIIKKLKVDIFQK